MIDMPWWQGVFTYENYNRVITEGSELKVSISPFENFEAYATYTHLRAVEYDPSQQTWKKLARRPEFSYTTGFKSQYKRLKFSAWAEHYSDRIDGSGEILRAFTTYNCYASYQLNDRVNFYLKGVNLTDKDYELAYGYNTMGRAFFAGVNLTFK
jgi:vitamin B12 transporter